MNAQGSLAATRRRALFLTFSCEGRRAAFRTDKRFGINEQQAKLRYGDGVSRAHVEDARQILTGNDAFCR